MSVCFQIRISYEELVSTKKFLENQVNQPKHSVVSQNGVRPDTNMRTRIISEETKRLLVKDLTPLKQTRKHSRETKNVTYPSTHGILRIPKEIDYILRCENAKHIRRKSNSNSTQDNWERFNQCASQLGDVCRQKECLPISTKLIPKARLLSEEMCQLAAHIIQSDYEFCEENSIEYELWHKNIFVFIEFLKEKSQISNDYSKQLFSFLISMRDYYAALISSVQSNYSFSLSIVDNINSIQSKEEQKKVLRGVLTCHFCYLSLGNIFIYLKELKQTGVGVSQEFDWSAVTGYYQKAVQLSPTNGYTYNQLATVSTNQQYYLDTVFYYVMSIAAQSPSLEVSESLVHVFHSIEKKSTNLQYKGKELTPPIQKHNNQCDNEVWIIPENSFKLSNQSEIPKTEKTDLKKSVQFKSTISPINFQQLFKDVYLSFLTIQAKLYTNIGIDSVSDWLSVFDCSLSSLLKNRCNQSFSEILLKMQIIALYSLTNQNTLSKSAQQYKVDFLFSFHFLLIQSMQRNIQYDSTIPTHVWYILPQIRVFVQWMRYNTNIINEYLQTFYYHRLWSVLSLLANQLHGLQLSTTPETINMFLWEDQMLSGCVITDKFIHTRISWGTVLINVEDTDSIHYRISLIISNLKVLSQTPNFPIYFESQIGTFNLHTESTNLEAKNINSDTPVTQDLTITSVEDSLEQCLLLDEEEYLSVETKEVITDELLLLKTEKSRLEAQVDKQTSGINKHKQQTRIKHEITPRYIIPDTNCFLSHISLLQKLYTNTTLQLIVPLIVLQELEHLRIPISKSYKHQSSCSKAKDAYSWLMEEFSLPKHKLLALTNQGNLVENPYTQDFSIVRNQINDDLILQSCVKLNKTWQKPSDAACTRSCVVLLTSDRNLRLKAVTQNLPAKSIKRFLTLINMEL